MSGGEFVTVALTFRTTRKDSTLLFWRVLLLPPVLLILLAVVIDAEAVLLHNGVPVIIVFPLGCVEASRSWPWPSLKMGAVSKYGALHKSKPSCFAETM